MRASLPAVLVTGALVACSPTTSNSNHQLEPDPDDGPTASVDTVGSASLLRRLAEAVDGFRDGRPRFVIASRHPPHHVAGVFTTRDSAADSVTALPDTADYGVFGPYTATEDPPQVVDSSEMVVEVIVVTRDTAKTRRYRGDRVDALFWSLPAFDKFVVPYLTAVHGPRYAAEERERYRLNQSRLAHSATVPHYRSSF